MTPDEEADTVEKDGHPRFEPGFRQARTETP
jgi:hypothetical protein